ncbi:phage tail protein [Emcibacter sp.]|uniref:phage tail protein n=1 Tax=Emcibacter sp. TaxID=1979954 RepID=UPI003A957819
MSKVKSTTAVMMAAGIFAVMGAGPVSAGVDPFLGDIQMTAANFCPRGWVETQGQLLPISSNSALFSLLGTTFGGDGRVTFALPDLRGRVAVGWGHGPGLVAVPMGQKAGSNSSTLTAQNMPSHNHTANTTTTIHASSADGDSPEPSSRILANDGNDDIYNSETPDVTLNSSAATSVTQIGNAGAGQSFSLMQPFLGVRFCIALQGVFPSRN